MSETSQVRSLQALSDFNAKMSVLSLKQLHSFPISISEAKDVLRGEWISENMIKGMLRDIIIKKLYKAGLEKQAKKESLLFEDENHNHKQSSFMNKLRRKVKTK